MIFLMLVAEQSKLGFVDDGTCPARQAGTTVSIPLAIDPQEESSGQGIFDEAIGAAGARLGLLLLTSLLLLMAEVRRGSGSGLMPVSTPLRVGGIVRHAWRRERWLNAGTLA